MRGKNGSDYLGVSSKTRSGKECVIWNSSIVKEQKPHNHPDNRKSLSAEDMNWCRNPDGDKTIWCYYKVGDNLSWEFCDELPCNKSECQEKEELLGNGTYYSGERKETKGGKPCVNWNDDKVKEDRSWNHISNNRWIDANDKNYCRNPDGEDTIWCYYLAKHDFLKDRAKKSWLEWQDCYPLDCK